MEKNNKKGKILSGIRPTGPCHIGHYEAILKNWVRLQYEYETTYEIADLHALTDRTETGDLNENIYEVLIDLLAVGIDPEVSTIFVQSHLPQHSELHLLLSMITPVPWLERCPTYKEKKQDIQSGEGMGYGLLGYPVLMATDILIHKGEYVPVGEDQLPHLELTREIVRRFNHLYDDVFVEPQAILTETPKILGVDNRKMSKSYGNAIFLKDTDDDIRAKIMIMITDPRRAYRKDPGHPEECNVYSFHLLYNSERTGEIAEACRNAGIGCRECKAELADRVIEVFSEYKERRRYFEGNRELLDDIIREGDKKAEAVASDTLLRVKRAMKLV